MSQSLTRKNKIVKDCQRNYYTRAAGAGFRFTVRVYIHPHRGMAKIWKSGVRVTNIYIYMDAENQFFQRRPNGTKLS